MNAYATLKILEPIVVDFRGSMWDCRPRMLWQKLFDFYRESGCTLEHLDNLLIDFGNCQELFDKKLLHPNEGVTVHFIFGCNVRDFMTTWVERERWWVDHDPKQTIEFLSYDRCLICSVNSNEAKLIPVIVEN